MRARCGRCRYCPYPLGNATFSKFATFLMRDFIYLHQLKPSPQGEGGTAWCSAQRIKNIYACRGQAYLDSRRDGCGKNRRLQICDIFPHISQLSLTASPQGEAFRRTSDARPYNRTKKWARFYGPNTITITLPILEVNSRPRNSPFCKKRTLELYGISQVDFSYFP